MSSYPHPTSRAVSIRMRANTRRDTRPELAVRQRLHHAGLRFFVDRPLRLPERVVRPDITFTRARVAVFVDGCFWHACPEHGTEPAQNSGYWGPKLQRNVARDRAVDQALLRAGWCSLRHWEHEAPDDVAASIASILADRKIRVDGPPDLHLGQVWSAVG
jgi:DNA mismatch endonuclease (patch repair protein)